ncbi:MAG: phosphotransferase, partial [Cellulomonadaceae bacterium]|nr:phosphotransferase [Cellulomonadaceae bacterium]
LHDALPVDASGPADPDAVVTTLLTRAAAAREAAPVLVSRTEAIERVLRTVGGLVPLPPLQRVHGDYHLGQALHSPARGWAVLDFEGEPQASAQERARPDLALRDLAGMLRSIDYAAAVGGATSTTWASDARASLVAAYLEESGHGSARAQDAASVALLRALELDKALYEVVYETRNRPSWVSIPLAGVDRLLEQPTAGDATP